MVFALPNASRIVFASRICCCTHVEMFAVTLGVVALVMVLIQFHLPYYPQCDRFKIKRLLLHLPHIRWGQPYILTKKCLARQQPLGGAQLPWDYSGTVLLWPIYNVLGLWLCVSCDSGNVLCAEYGMARFRHCVHSQLGLFSCNGRGGSRLSPSKRWRAANKMKNSELLRAIT